MGRIVLFVRVSTLGQQLESQEDSLRRAALADGHSESDFIIISNKESAIKLSEEEREGLNDLKRVIESEDVSCIYIAELSRLSRRPQILYSIREQLLHKRIQLKCLHPQFTLLTEDRTKYDATANIIFSLFGALAEQEMLEKKERFARGKRRKADEGKYNGGAIPFGYRIDAAQDNLIVVDEEDSKIVKMIFDMYENGFSQPKLAREMAETGHADVTISMINNILNNESYCGVKRKTKMASYERAYPPIITVEQYQKCRQIADTNNTTINKAKNIYFAEHLVKCPTCGAYWAAGGSKASYHCSVAYKSMSIWKYEHHKKEKCTNKMSFSINVLDSILWHVAIEKEACYIEQASQEKIDGYKREVEKIEAKLANIQPRIEELNAKKERLREMYVDGMRKETYDKKSREIAEKINAIKSEQIKYKDELKHVKDTIDNLNDIRLSRPISVEDVEEFFSGKKGSIGSKYPIEHAMLTYKIKQITDDSERHKIIKRQIKSAEVIPTIIRFPFGIGIRDIKAREVIIHSYIPSHDQKQIGWDEGRDCFYVIPNGGSGPMILDIAPDEYTEGVDPTFYSYGDNTNYYYTDIAPEILMIRYKDVPKKQKRNLKKEKDLELIGDMLPLREVAKRLSYNYGTLFGRIGRGEVKSVVINGKHYLHIEDVEELLARDKAIEEKIGNRMSLLDIVKKYYVSYSNVLSLTKKGVLPSEFINGKYVVRPEDAEEYFTSDNRRNYVMGDMMPASTVAKKYHVSYKSVLKKVRSGECPSVIYQHYYYIDPKIAEDFFGKDE